jgi:hypothetical protein
MAMDSELVRRIHDAAVELGAKCDSDCSYWGGPSQSKSAR